MLGPSGCGQVQRISTIAGFQLPQAGDIRVNAEAVVKPDPTASCFAAADTLPLENGGAEREFWPEAPGRSAKGMEGSWRRNSAESRSVGIWPALSRPFARQYTAAASVLPGCLSRSRVLPQDETFSSLNAQIRLMMREFLLDVWSEYRMSVLCYSDVDEAGLSGFVRLSLHAGKDVSKRSFIGTARPRSAGLLVFRRIHKATARSMDLQLTSPIRRPVAG